MTINGVQGGIGNISRGGGGGLEGIRGVRLNYGTGIAQDYNYVSCCNHTLF